MRAADPVQLREYSDGQRGHVECGTRGVRVLTQAEKRVTREAQLFPVATEVALDQRDREDVVSGGNRRMSSKDGALAHKVGCLSVGLPSLDQLSGPLQGEERGMSLVGMPDNRREPQRPAHPHATDAEQHFLAEADFLIAAVESGGEFAVFRRVLR